MTIVGEHSLVFTLLVLFGSAMAGTSLPRMKRGASVYPVFPSGGGYNSHNPYSSNDPTVFIQYLGGSGGISNRRSGSASAASTYSATTAPAPGSNYTPQSASANHAFDSNILNSYALSSHSQQSSTPSSTSGWSPSSSYGYSGSFYTSDFGHLTPNFANGGSSTPSYSRPHVPSLNANSLLHSAQTTFQAQNHLYDVLLSSAPRPQSYKGSSGY
ncbi:unnamed protein product [Allacma fusca]|uniref:Uncharacterized protein n=1 Tax=Allacma fusca TaxID=39272 RepID=A0A8J2MC22_9HEXA|nr:unnamed protein product [Allacma fusca]